MGTAVVRVVSVEPLLNGTRCHGKCSSSRRRLNSFKVEPIGGARRNQRLYFVDDFRVEGFFEPPFWRPRVGSRLGGV